MRGRRVLVTGATGFVGGALVQHLLEIGVEAKDLRLLVRDPQKASKRGLPPESPVVGELGDRRAVGEGAAGAELVIHIAGTITSLSRRDFNKVNADGTASLIEVLAERAPACPPGL